MGVRDLCRVGDDIIVLAGPTMDLDGPVRLYRWRGGALTPDATVVRRDDLRRVGKLPHGRGETAGKDHAEGITLLPAGGTRPRCSSCTTVRHRHGRTTVSSPMS
ncbi:DUF3616 domain-containing protein [Modestobacter sp. DSM 44400]|uniref:DUF3616 domain-containing protein n=1 Tax=Modestobacter sp. DSM 44400 TaxID=1550230 RepID=UPI0020C8E1EE|nr:DUF3616 domain-containing protein [Modestobacter sp. DSM 44400]